MTSISDSYQAERRRLETEGRQRELYYRACAEGLRRLGSELRKDWFFYLTHFIRLRVMTGREESGPFIAIWKRHHNLIRIECKMVDGVAVYYSGAGYWQNEVLRSTEPVDYGDISEVANRFRHDIGEALARMRAQRQ